jgi:hypothetical protein
MSDPDTKESPLFFSTKKENMDTNEKVEYKKIQLWSNQSKNEYAIRLEGNVELLAATKTNIHYTELVDESEYLEDLKYNWRYTLKAWMARQT